MTYLNLRGVVSHQLLPLAPFDEDGNMLDEASIREMDAEYKREFEAECARLRAAVRTGLDAAEARELEGEVSTAGHVDARWSAAEERRLPRSLRGVRLTELLVPRPVPVSESGRLVNCRGHCLRRDHDHESARSPQTCASA
jgi:hypothetical protein